MQNATAETPRRRGRRREDKENEVVTRALAPVPARRDARVTKAPLALLLRPRRLGASAVAFKWIPDMDVAIRDAMLPKLDAATFFRTLRDVGVSAVELEV